MQAQQLKNAGFENWSATESDGWVSGNILMLLGNSQSMFKSTSGYSGNAAEINTIHVTSKPPGANIPDYGGTLASGKLVGLTPVAGVPYTYKPSSMQFWYKYVPTAGDSSGALVAFTKWNATSMKRDTVAFGFAVIKDSTTIYTKKEFNITYFNSNIPDTVIVLFLSSGVSVTQAGSKFTVDEVMMLGGNTGIQSTANISFHVYPNPAKDYLYIDLKGAFGELQYHIFDTQGRMIYNEKVNHLNHIALRSLPAGVYFIKVTSGQGSASSKFIVE